MEPLSDFLYSHTRQNMPVWLQHFDPSQPFDKREFFRSRVGYYPGSGYDGHLVRLFGGTHSVHCFVYVDYWATRDDIVHGVSRFRGYRPISIRDVSPMDLAPRGWSPHVEAGEISESTVHRALIRTPPYGLFTVLERKASYPALHGPERLAIVFLGADAIATYDAIFGQSDGTPAPFVILLQDHGFGGNYDKFGNGGLLHRIAVRTNALPKCLLVAQGTAPWDSYVRVEGVQPDAGGVHNTPRSLFRRAADSRRAGS